MNDKVTRSMLTDSMFLGTPISLWVSHNGLHAIVKGRITQLSLESGPDGNGVAHNFNVVICPVNGVGTYNAYVKTLD